MPPLWAGGKGPHSGGQVMFARGAFPGGSARAGVRSVRAEGAPKHMRRPSADSGATRPGLSIKSGWPGLSAAARTCWPQPLFVPANSPISRSRGHPRGHHRFRTSGSRPSRGLIRPHDHVSAQSVSLTVDLSPLWWGQKSIPQGWRRGRRRRPRGPSRQAYGGAVRIGREYRTQWSPADLWLGSLANGREWPQRPPPARVKPW